MKHWNAGVGLALLGLVVAPGSLLAQGGAEGGGAALFDVNLGLSLWTVVVFLLLLFILGKFAWGPILSAAETREARIQRALDEASRRQAEASELLEQHKAQLADARRQAQEIVNEGKAAGEQVAKEITERARSEGQELLERARRDIGREKDAALNEIRKETVDLALAAAARLIHRKLDPEQDRTLVTSYLDELAGRDEASAGGSPA